MNFFQKLRCFTWRGRMTRKPFIIYSILLMCTGLPFFAASLCMGEESYTAAIHAMLSGSDGGIYFALIIALLLAYLYVSVCLFAQRLHDFGVTGWVIAGVFVLQALVPVFYWVMAAAAMLWPTSKKNNRYGMCSPKNELFLRVE